MNNSELNYLTGCLGLYGETREAAVKNVVEAYGPKNHLHYSDDSDANKAGAVFNKVFKNR